MKINFNLLRSFRKNLKALKITKKELESELLHLRSEIKNYELAIDYVERNIKRNKNAKPRRENNVKVRNRQ